ncbi:ECF RNA polymerase sigma factor SigW [Planctomycetes bacterium Pan216]|uniref:RNA polymerase sigma factor n=1 Tax=Kolteria novifilia TaxID=2527975 RepID=A0A518B182_9BACT|nr:ECF RNA polymerase sigma factor SigW [Planctomycetes bacterium Pan216]
MSDLSGSSVIMPEQEVSEVTDNDLITDVMDGDQDAYAELVHRYEKKLARTIYRMVGSVETAEDLTQDTFLKAYGRLDRFDNSKRFSPWLFQIGVNTAIDWLRRNRKRSHYSLQEMSGGEGTFDVADADPQPKYDLSQEVHFVLHQIPVQYRTVLMLRDLEGFPCSEVAAILQRREPTIRWRLLKAREMFRELWERREKESGEST